MPIITESFIEEKDEDKFLLDIIDTTLKKGFPAYVSKDEKVLSIALPLENKKEVIGEAFVVTEVNMEEPRLFDCDIVINNKANSGNNGHKRFIKLSKKLDLSK